MNLDRCREVVIKVQDEEGRAVGRRTIGLVRFNREGGLEFTSDEAGEVNLLLEPGMYGGRGPAGPLVQFEVAVGGGKQVVTFPGKQA